MYSIYAAVKNDLENSQCSFSFKLISCFCWCWFVFNPLAFHDFCAGVVHCQPRDSIFPCSHHTVCFFDYPVNERLITLNCNLYSLFLLNWLSCRFLKWDSSIDLHLWYCLAFPFILICTKSDVNYGKTRCVHFPGLSILAGKLIFDPFY